MNLSHVLPNSAHLQELLPERYSKEIEGLLNKNLIHPIQDFFRQPGKNLRPLIVKVGYLLSFEEEPDITPEVQLLLDKASAIVELIHSGSLIVDDIQDGSEERRNGPSMHMKHGVPLALNAGNWLYFHALCLVKELGLGPTQTLDVLDDLLDLMGKAHLGQALDLGTRINEVPLEEVRRTCITSMELKTGTLIAIALRLGMAVSENSKNKHKVLDLGHRMGLALQMFDDVANFTNVNGKQFEDLYNRRPSWVWAKVSELGEDAFSRFYESVEALPDSRSLNEWSEAHGFSLKLYEEVRHYLGELSDYWNSHWGKSHPQSIRILNHYKTILETSYVQKT